MNKYNIYVMESKNGLYTMKWVLLGNTLARNTSQALYSIEPIRKDLEIHDFISITRNQNNTIFEYNNCKYYIELI